MSVPALMQRPGKGICTLWTPYTLCHFTTMNNSYARYTQDICQCRLLLGSSLYSLGADPTENTVSNSSSIVACVSVAAVTWFDCRWNVFTQPLPCNGSLFRLHYSCKYCNMTVLSTVMLQYLQEGGVTSIPYPSQLFGMTWEIVLHFLITFS
jgi:hypothetical protein